MIYDLIIIGGGMSGISIADLFRRQKILLIEKSHLLSGATGNNAGFLIAGFGEHFRRTVTRHGIEMACEIQEIHRASHRRIRQRSTILASDYVQSGSLSVPLDEKEKEELVQSCKLLKEAGYKVEWRESAQTGLNRRTEGLFNPDDAFIDAPSFWSKLADRLPVRFDSPVFQIENQADHVVVYTKDEAYRTENLVFCMDAYSAELVPELKGRFLALRGQIVEVASESTTPPVPVIAEYGNVYWRFAAGKLILGGLESYVPQEETGIAENLSEAIEQIQLEWIRNNFVIKNGEKLSSRFGTMAYTLDGFPFVGALPQPRRFVLAGTCGLGHSWVPEAASWLHALIAEGRNVIPPYCSSDRIKEMPVHKEGDWRTLYEAWNY